MATRSVNAKIKNLLRHYPVFHWFGYVDEAHYLDFTEYIKDLREAVKAKEGSIKSKWPNKVVLYLNSHGGDPSIAQGFYDYVKSSGLHLITIAAGDVESAADILFLAGKERYASRFSSFLFHDAEIEGHFNISIRNVEQIHHRIAAIHNRYVEIVSLETGLTAEKVDELSLDASPISSERAKELGIVHEIF